jgi:hypothetical protein
MRKHAYVTLAHTEAGRRKGNRAVGDVILNMAASQFDDFEAVGLAREATPAEVTAEQKRRGVAKDTRAAAKPKSKPAPATKAKKSPSAPRVTKQAPPAAPETPSETSETPVI